MVHANIEKIRKARGITKTHVAKKLGMSLQGYSHIAAGQSRIDVERMRVIADILQVDPSVLMDNKLTESVVKEIDAGLNEQACSSA